jgi:hypothetical protein
VIAHVCNENYLPLNEKQVNSPIERKRISGCCLVEDLLPPVIATQMYIRQPMLKSETNMFKMPTQVLE